MTVGNFLTKDLDFIVQHCASLWDMLRDQSIFITGGTGFFGAWLLESFVRANELFQLNANATVLSRKPLAFEAKCPHLFHHAALHFHQGDVRDFSFLEGRFSHIIHAATDARAVLNEHNPVLMFDTVLEGTRRVLEFAKKTKAKRFLMISSGAVYGRQPPALSHVCEEYDKTARFDDHKSAYAIGKYSAEHLCYLYAKQHNIDVKIARCFAFVGPYLPLDIHFAIGNFIRHGLHAEPILIAGDGTPVRSYLYAADLMIWLWTILLKGKIVRPYNVGSDEAISIASLAAKVASCFDPVPPIYIAKTTDRTILPERYVPDISRARHELGLIPRTSLTHAIQTTIDWHRLSQSSLDNEFLQKQQFFTS